MCAMAVRYLPPESLVAVEQIRKEFNDSSLTGLALSLRTHGMLQPIRARAEGDKLVIICGERRWRAAVKAGLQTVPVIVEEGSLDEAATISTQIVENVQRCDLLPLEKASAIQQLMKATGWNAAETGRKLGLSSAMVSKLLALLTLPDTIKSRLAEGKLALSTAYELAKVGDPVKQSELANEAANGLLKRDQVSNAAKRLSRRGPSSGKRRPSRITATLGQGCWFNVSGEGVSLESLIGMFEQFVEKAKAAQAQDIPLDDFLGRLKNEAKT